MQSKIRARKINRHICRGDTSPEKEITVNTMTASRPAMTLTLAIPNAQEAAFCSFHSNLLLYRFFRFICVFLHHKAPHLFVRHFLLTNFYILLSRVNDQPPVLVIYVLIKRILIIISINTFYQHLFIVLSFYLCISLISFTILR